MVFTGILTLSLSAMTTGEPVRPITDREMFVPITAPTPKPVPPPIIDTFGERPEPLVRPKTVVPQPTPKTVTIKPKAPRITTVKSSKGFILDRNVSWYGPGFYGKRTACGLAYTKTILGVAHKTLPCGTKVTFMWKSRVITVPVIDRGPYVAGRQWDLSGGLCTYLNHCFTGSIYYRIGSH